ncbi:patatin-like phospholipase family protein [Candidatus Nitrosacidococcus tergens]|uniref:Putative Patatin-like phospholipase n=1 Tax=Candidatus Nitrosacidococcus tergens TaxID=553981 RepID=A0A7G1Q958_9GAMM|nr:patatin-like phospholipase family protein [Candidatus Nitrosacidococcus tergens]CAB1275497.1 putative Patatin-like phospholipase [Candidatus Nitrosacidococcus tergens]
MGLQELQPGGLISIALGAGVDIKEVRNIYAIQAADIFTKVTWADCWSERGEEATSVSGAEPGVFCCSYTADGLTKIMTSHIGNRTFGDLPRDKMVMAITAQLDDLTASPVQWKLVMFSNQGPENYSKVKLIDACLATSAAPAYFPPYEVPGMGFFADGGIFANNPILNSIELAQQGQLVAGYSEVEVISFGTGLSPMGIPPSAIPKPKTWGTSTWMYPCKDKDVPAMALLNAMFNLSSSNITRIAEGLLGDSLVRINPVMSQEVPIDSYSPADYTVMNEAIKSAKKSPEWCAAKDMINKWCR